MFFINGYRFSLYFQIALEVSIVELSLRGITERSSYFTIFFCCCYIVSCVTHCAEIVPIVIGWKVRFECFFSALIRRE